MPSPIDDHSPYATDPVAYLDTDNIAAVVIDFIRVLGRPPSTRPAHCHLRMIAKVDHQRRVIVAAAAPASF